MWLKYDATFGYTWVSLRKKNTLFILDKIHAPLGVLFQFTCFIYYFVLFFEKIMWHIWSLSKEKVKLRKKNNLFLLLCHIMKQV